MMDNPSDESTLEETITVVLHELRKGVETDLHQIKTALGDLATRLAGTSDPDKK